MKIRPVAAAALGMATAFLAAQASASNVTLYEDPSGFYTGDDIGTVNNPGLAGGSQSNVVIGPLNMIVSPGSQPISDGVPLTVYCTDLLTHFTPGQTFLLTLNPLSGLSATKIGWINALLDNTAIQGGDAGAAVQAAIWEIMNKSTATSPYKVDTGDFTATVTTGNNTAFVALTNTYLNNVTSGAWVANPDDVLQEFVPVDNTNQTFSYITNTGGGNNGTPVPEPASLGVLGLGLVGLVAARRSRKSNQQA